jgi:hypothetical protein
VSVEEVLPRNNSAARLHALFRKAHPSKDNESARTVWARALDMPDLIERVNAVQVTILVRQLVLMANELDQVRAFAVLSHWPPRLWEKQLNSLQAALALGSLEGAFSHNRIGADMLLALD